MSGPPWEALEAAVGAAVARLAPRLEERLRASLAALEAALRAEREREVERLARELGELPPERLAHLLELRPGAAEPRPGTAAWGEWLRWLATQIALGLPLGRELVEMGVEPPLGVSVEWDDADVPVKGFHRHQFSAALGAVGITHWKQSLEAVPALAEALARGLALGAALAVGRGRRLAAEELAEAEALLELPAVLEAAPGPAWWARGWASREALALASRWAGWETVAASGLGAAVGPWRAARAPAALALAAGPILAAAGLEGAVAALEAVPAGAAAPLWVTPHGWPVDPLAVALAAELLEARQDARPELVRRVGLPSAWAVGALAHTLEGRPELAGGEALVERRYTDPDEVMIRADLARVPKGKRDRGPRGAEVRVLVPAGRLELGGEESPALALLYQHGTRAVRVLAALSVMLWASRVGGRRAVWLYAGDLEALLGVTGAAGGAGIREAVARLAEVLLEVRYPGGREEVGALVSIVQWAKKRGGAVGAWEVVPHPMLETLLGGEEGARWLAVPREVLLDPTGSAVLGALELAYRGGPAGGRTARLTLEDWRRRTQTASDARALAVAHELHRMGLLESVQRAGAVLELRVAAPREARWPTVPASRAELERWLERAERSGATGGRPAVEWAAELAGVHPRTVREALRDGPPGSLGPSLRAGLRRGLWGW